MGEKKIVVVSRHSIVLHGLKVMLHAATPHYVTGDSRPIDQISSILQDYAPDLVIVDIGLRRDALDQLRAAFSAVGNQTKLLLVGDIAEHLGSLDADFAEEVIPSEGDAMDVLKAVSRALEPPVVPAPASLFEDLAAQTIRFERPGNPLKEETHLTPREKQVVELIRQGYCNKRIARALNIGFTTVRSHRQKVMEKLGLRNAVEIALFAAGPMSPYDITLV